MPQAPFVINPALSAIVNDYSTINRGQRGYIADQVLARTRVDALDFRYVEYPIEEAFDSPDTQVNRRSKPNEVTLTATEATGSVLDYGLDAPVPFRDEQAQRSQSIPFPLRARAARIATDKVQLAREIRVANLVFAAGNYQTGYKSTLSGTGQFSDLTNSDPVAVINDAIAGMLVKPNTAVMGQEVLNILRRHPKVSVALGGSEKSGRYVPNEELASILGVEKIIVGNTLYQTSKKGQTLATARVWGKHLALLNTGTGDPTTGVVDDPGQPAFGYTFQWGDRIAGEIADPDMGLLGGVRVRSGEMLVEKLVAPYAGYLFTNAVA